MHSEVFDMCPEFRNQGGLWEVTEVGCAISSDSPSQDRKKLTHGGVP